MHDYKLFRESHPGPISQKSFLGWKARGGCDMDTFKWKKTKPNYYKMYKIQNKKIKNKKQIIYRHKQQHKPSLYNLSSMTVHGNVHIYK